MSKYYNVETERSKGIMPYFPSINLCIKLRKLMNNSNIIDYYPLATYYQMEGEYGYELSPIPSQYKHCNLHTKPGSYVHAPTFEQVFEWARLNYEMYVTPFSPDKGEKIRYIVSYTCPDKMYHKSLTIFAKTPDEIKAAKEETVKTIIRLIKQSFVCQS